MAGNLTLSEAKRNLEMAQDDLRLKLSALQDARHLRGRRHRDLSDLERNAVESTKQHEAAHREYLEALKHEPAANP